MNEARGEYETRYGGRERGKEKTERKREEKEEERSFSQEQCPKSQGRMRSVGLHENTRTNLVGAHWSPIDTLLPNGKTHAASLLRDRRQIHRRIYCFAGRYVIWPLSSEPRARPRCESRLCRSRWTSVAGSTQMTIRHIAVLGSSYFFLVVKLNGERELFTLG